MIRPVIKRGDPLLTKRSRKITNLTFVESVVDDLEDSFTAIKRLYNFTRRSGISGPQIGELWRVSIVEFASTSYTLINPKITHHSKKKLPVREGCLSFFDYRGMVLRYPAIVIEATNQEGQPFTLKATGDFSSLLQHELDHLNGKLYDSQLAPGEKLFKLVNMPRIP